MLSLFETMIEATIRLSVPIILMAIGNQFAEKAGVMNLGAEGMMTMGSFTAVLGAYYSGSAVVGVLSGIVGGMLVATIHSLNTVEFGGNQNISGLGLNTLAAGLSAFLCRELFSSGITPSVQNLQRTEILRKIPLVGHILSRFSPLMYISIIIIIVSLLFMKKTTLGMRIVAVGDDPTAAETAGINVWNVRHLAVCVFCGICGGLAGAYLSIGQLSFFQDDLVNGKGMLAVIAVKMGKWNIGALSLVALMFGFFDALQVQIQINFPSVSPELVELIPYIVAVIALFISGENSAQPKALTQPYLKNKYKF